MPILEQKIANIKETGAAIAACACSGCMAQIQGGLDKQLPGVKMKARRRHPGGEDPRVNHPLIATGS